MKLCAQSCYNLTRNNVVSLEEKGGQIKQHAKVSHDPLPTRCRGLFVQTPVATTTYLLSTAKMHMCKSDVLCRNKRRLPSLVPILSGSDARRGTGDESLPVPRGSHRR